MNTAVFIFSSLLLGVGLAMDAFSVSLASGLNEPRMRRPRMCAIAGVFAFFQALMPMTGWLLLSLLVERFAAFQRWIPWIALVLLAYIGGKMLYEGIRTRLSDKRGEGGAPPAPPLSVGALLLQGVATSIDALSVGFTIASYDVFAALSASLIIAAVTFVICMAGLFLGKAFGTRLGGSASIFGGVILIAIGIEVFLRGILG